MSRTRSIDLRILVSCGLAGVLGTIAGTAVTAGSPAAVPLDDDRAMVSLIGDIRREAADWYGSFLRGASIESEATAQMVRAEIEARIEALAAALYARPVRTALDLIAHAELAAFHGAYAADGRMQELRSADRFERAAAHLAVAALTLAPHTDAPCCLEQGARHAVATAACGAVELSATERSIFVDDRQHSAVGNLIDALGGSDRVAGRLGVDPEIVRGWVASGDIPPAWHYRLFRLAQQRDIAGGLIDEAFGMTEFESHLG